MNAKLQEFKRVAIVFVLTVVFCHFSFLVRKVIRDDAPGYVFALLILGQFFMFAVLGAVVAQFKWKRAEWYMAASFVMVGIMYRLYYPMIFSLGHLYSALFYGLLFASISNAVVKRSVGGDRGWGTFIPNS